MNAGISFNRSAQPRPHCDASGWGVTEGCTNGHGYCLCPRCLSIVKVETISRHAVRIVSHRRTGRCA